VTTEGGANSAGCAAVTSEGGGSAEPSLCVCVANDLMGFGCWLVPNAKAERMVLGWGCIAPASAAEEVAGKSGGCAAAVAGGWGAVAIDESRAAKRSDRGVGNFLMRTEAGGGVG
jgi:hypothetical protein